MQDDRCDDKEPHYSHPHELEVLSTCSGLTPCGEIEHDPHEHVMVRRIWCPGICDCGMRSGTLHGPGAHK